MTIEPCVSGNYQNKTLLIMHGRSSLTLVQSFAFLRPHKRLGPDGVFGREQGIRLAGVDEIFIARRIIDVMEDLLEIDRRIRIARKLRDGDDRQALA